MDAAFAAPHRRKGLSATIPQIAFGARGVTNIFASWRSHAARHDEVMHHIEGRSHASRHDEVVHHIEGRSHASRHDEVVHHMEGRSHASHGRQH
jgi:hypothetical protein